RLFLRRDDEWFWRDVQLFGKDSACGPLGDCRLHPRAATEPLCKSGRPAGGFAAEAGSGSDFGGGQGMTAQEYNAPGGVGRLEQRALVVGVLGVVLSVVGLIMDSTAFYRAYLVAFLFVLGWSLGSLGLLMMQHLTGGQWGILIRRPLEAASRVLYLLPVLF